ncbi:MAG TPA: FlgD immunoglobulin-like domain containing protein [Candidatus Limnocylindrales bacterium]|nr:FlgD immunoglobulin-like domain containing protein [Candidatus Limnocylindrales bacterium]
MAGGRSRADDRRVVLDSSLTEPREPVRLPMLARALLGAVLAAFLVLPAAGFAPRAAAATPDPKVVVIVGPVGDHNAHYKDDARAIIAEAQKYTSNVVKIFTPHATWGRVKRLAQGANVLVYLGHGNGWPSIYTPWQPYTKDGFGLDPDSGADGAKHVYYGEYYIARDIRLAPNSVVLFYHLCYASGNTEPGLSEGSFKDSKKRVDNYGAGFLAAGARAVLADGHPIHPATDYIRRLFTTRRTIDQLFHTDPAYNGNVVGPYDSTRTPGLQYELDPDRGGSDPSGFYRSVVGQLDLTTTQVTGTVYAPTDEDPADFVVPGAAEVTAPDGVPFFDSNANADDPAATGSATLPAATRLRLTASGTPMADGSRVFAADTLDGSRSGWVRATGLTPRDSLATRVWSADAAPPVVSPNADGTDDGLTISARFSEPVDAKLTIRDSDGTAVASFAASGDVLRFDWDGTSGGGAVVPDGDYTWKLSGADGWGNDGASATGSFIVDTVAPKTTASIGGTAGDAGWLTSAATVTLSATDATSDVMWSRYAVDEGSMTDYAGKVTISAQGEHTLTYRSKDLGSNLETKHTKSFAIDSAAPVVTATTTGTAGDSAGWYRSSVSLALAASDATSGLVGATYAVDGGPAAALPATVALTADGPHQVVVAARDVAGNVLTRTYSITIDTVAPVVSLPTTVAGTSGGGGVESFSPNGDGFDDTFRQHFTLSEPAAVTVEVRNAAGTTVRTLTLAGTSGSNAVTWDGRTASGATAPDGLYQLVITARDKAGNVGVADDATLAVYGALTGVEVSASRFYPQDGDRLSRTDTISFRLRRAATVTLRVLDASGRVVRNRYVAASLAAGTYSWAWNGRRGDGTMAPQGTYRFELVATDGTGSETRTQKVYAGAFGLASSRTTVRRGGKVTITARSTEALSANPRLVVDQPGIAAWRVTMTKVGHRRYAVTIRLKSAGSAGTVRFRVVGTDSRDGRNTSTWLRLAIS